MRLIQGDVGCGKTAIAFAAGILMNSNDFQVALMCPTESLARQHYKNLNKICPGSQNALLLEALKSKKKTIFTMVFLMEKLNLSSEHILWFKKILNLKI